MASAVMMEPVMELADDLKQQVLESDRCIRQAWNKLRKASQEIGWEGAFLRANNAWFLLGCENEDAYRVKVGIGRSTWFRMVGIAECFTGLTKSKFMAMSITNAEQLAKKSLLARQNLTLVNAAALNTGREFNAVLESKPVGEIYVTMKWRIKQVQHEVIAQGLEDWQHEHGFDDDGYALEQIIAAARQRDTLIRFVDELIPKLDSAMLTAKGSVKLRGVVAVLVGKLEEISKKCKEEMDCSSQQPTGFCN